MSITHITAHYLKCDAESEAKLSLRQEELAADDKKEELLDKLKSSFLARLSRKHGSFAEPLEDEAPSLLVQELDGFASEKRSFSQLSAAVMERLKQAVNENGIEINAHFLFFVEEAGDHHHIFYLFIVNQNESLAISEQLEVTPSYFIDTGPSLSAIKVDLAEWKDRKNYAYLTLLTPRGNPLLTDALEDLAGFSNGLDTEEVTRNFLEGVDSFAKQVPDDQVNDYKAAVVDYCLEQEKKDEPVDIEALSKGLEGVDSQKFVSEMQSYRPADDEEIMVNRRSLQRYVKFAGREKDLAISFSTYHLHTRVDYDEESDTLVIRGIPSALRKQLMAHLNL